MRVQIIKVPYGMVERHRHFEAWPAFWVIMIVVTVFWLLLRYLIPPTP